MGDGRTTIEGKWREMQPLQPVNQQTVLHVMSIGSADTEEGSVWLYQCHRQTIRHVNRVIVETSENRPDHLSSNTDKCSFVKKRSENQNKQWGTRCLSNRLDQAEAAYIFLEQCWTALFTKFVSFVDMNANQRWLQREQYCYSRTRFSS